MKFLFYNYLYIFSEVFINIIIVLKKKLKNENFENLTI
jgi:hypothetical protein